MYTAKELYKQDLYRHNNHTSLYMKVLMYTFRKAQCTNKILYRLFYRLLVNRKLLEIPYSVKIGGGLYIGHCSCITINKNAVLGSNINIHKGGTIGQENRGKRKGAPKIGNCVWIGINATIVGRISIGDDVLIAPNTYVNCDIPSHSVVFGNPCIIKPKANATEGYINNKCID